MFNAQLVLITLCNITGHQDRNLLKSKIMILVVATKTFTMGNPLTSRLFYQWKVKKSLTDVRRVISNISQIQYNGALLQP